MPTSGPGRVHVAYWQIYLHDDLDDDTAIATFEGSPIGLVGVAPGRAILATGVHTGVVGFQVEIADREPAPQLEQYEDIVEIDFECRSADVALVEWCGQHVHHLPDLPAGAGTYRLRYHARGMDAAHLRDTSPSDTEYIDEYLLQIWPALPAPPAILKLTSDYAQHRQQRRGRQASSPPPATPGAVVMRVGPPRPRPSPAQCAKPAAPAPPLTTRGAVWSRPRRTTDDDD